MNKVASRLLPGSFAALSVLLAACTGTRPEEHDRHPAVGGHPAVGAPEVRGPSVPASAPERAADRARARSQDPPAPRQDDPLAQRRQFLIEQSLQRARAAMTNKLWEQVREECAFILQLDPTHDEARRLLIDAQTFLGERRPTAVQDHTQRVIQAEVEKERARMTALDYERQGDFALEREEFEEAIEQYTRARYTIVYNPYFPPGSPEERRLDTKIRSAEQAREEAILRRDRETERVARVRLEEEERLARARREARVRRLYEEANLAFQRQRYNDAIELLQHAIEEDPTQEHARELLALAQRARHDQNMEELRRRWKTAWRDTFEDIITGDLPQTDPIVHDLQHWKTEVLDRGPIEFTPPDDVDTPEDREVLRILEERAFAHQFPEATVEEWAAWYQQATGVNFLVSARLREMDPDETTLRNFNLPRMPVMQALETIGRITRVRWHVANGLVHLLSPEEDVGRPYLAYHDVRSLVSPIPSNPGTDITLRAPGEDAPMPYPDDPVPTVVSGDHLVDLIRDNIEPESWDVLGYTIDYQQGTLVVRHVHRIQEKIERLLDDLRRSVGIQVNIESRFLRVEDNFLEEVGIDFRGLGNQASEGVPGRGLETKRPRPGAGFDDFGRRENISPSSPGEIGTGTEPGIFFDDGDDGDIMARTQNLFDLTLGGGPEGLSNAGGLSLQWAMLGDTELQVVMRAVSKQERVEEITAPQLLLFNTQRGNLTVTRQFSYIKDFEVEIAQASAVADPVVGVVKDGVVLDVRPVVSADRRFITMELRPTVATLALPIPTFTTTLGVGQPISIQLPQLTIQKVRTTVTIPDGGTLMLGGMKLAEKQNLNSGVPILRDIPVVSFLFSRKGTYLANKKILILLRAAIVIPQEYEPRIREAEGMTLTRGGR